MAHVAVTLAASSASRKATGTVGTLRITMFDWVLFRKFNDAVPQYVSNEKDLDAGIPNDEDGIISKHTHASFVLVIISQATEGR